jgi:vanillate O-demethylase ferredoxin subunit
VRLGDGLVRDFSLWNDPAERARYCIAVLREPEGRGSREWHEVARVGEIVEASTPRNNFPLAAEAEHYLLIAGGIGITPIRPLAEEMAADGFDVRVLYRAHSEGHLVFKKEMDALTANLGVRVDYLVTQAGSSRSGRAAWFSPANLARLVPDIAGRVVYVCGPPGMMAAVRASLDALGVPSGQVRTEAFRLQ